MADLLIPLAISSQLDVTGEERVHAAKYNPIDRPEYSPPPIVPVTWDPANKGTDVVLSAGNLAAQCPSFYQSVSATVARSTGKYQFEVGTAEVGGTTSSALCYTGLAIDGSDFTGNSMAKIIGATSVNNSIGYEGRGSLGGANSGFVQWWFGGAGNTASTGASGDVIPTRILTVAVDLDADTVGFYLDGVSKYSMLLPASQVWRPATSVRILSGKQIVVTANFGATAMAFPVSGYLAWNGATP